jgi:(R,R)-butanediol dehydrogenase / meso-butanediol dehydrogenase / diacetyl reductase
VRAACFVKPGHLEIREVPDPEPGEGELLLAVSHCGICGSDLHEYTSSAPSMRAAGVFQPVMGHELTGRVVATGPGVTDFSEGDAVVVHPGGPCGACYYCKNGSSNLCAEQLGVGYRISGGYAEYVCVRAGQASRLPDASWLEAAALTEPLGVALRAVNRGALRPGESVFIAGGGPIGLLTVIAARRKGAGTVIVSEPAAARRGLALRLGADHALDPAGACLAVRERTGALGADIAIECVGIDATMNDCIASVRRGGRIVVAGAFEQPYGVNLLSLVVQEHAIIGTFGYAAEFEEARDLIIRGEVDVSPLISRTVPLESVPSVFEELTSDRNTDHKVLVAGGRT